MSMNCTRLGPPDVARAAQATAADGLRVRALDAGAGGVARPERLGLLVPARALQRLEVLARLQPDDARLALGARAARPQRARRAVPSREAGLPYHAVLGPGVRQPGDALVVRRAGHDAAFPVHPEH